MIELVLVLLVIGAYASWRERSPEQQLAHDAARKARNARVNAFLAKWLLRYLWALGAFLVLDRVWGELPPEVGAWLGEYAVELVVLAAAVVVVRRWTRDATMVKHTH